MKEITMNTQTDSVILVFGKTYNSTSKTLIDICLNPTKSDIFVTLNHFSDET